MHATEQTMRGGRLDKPLAELTGLQHTARQKVAGLLPGAPSRSTEAPADPPEPLTPTQQAERAKRAREQKLMIAAALAVLLLTVWLRRKTADSA